MREQLLRKGGAVLCLALLSGCGYVSEPLPPALNIPIPIADLRAVQRGDKIVAAFTIPVKTTEGLEVTELRSVELRAGPGGPPPFQMERWAAGAKQLIVDTSQSGSVEVEIPVGGWAGSEVFLAARAQGSKRRWSGWSNVIPVQVVPPLPAPTNVTAAATGEGVRLSWTGTGSYRIFRKGSGEKTFSRIGNSDKPEFVDGNAEYGKTYEYAVQAAVKAGAGEAQSETSAVVSITAEDKFAPAAPAGLTVLAGTGSVELGWDRNTEPDLAGYFVYRAEGDGQFSRMGDRIDVPSFSDRQVQSGKRYRYRITSVDLKGNESEPSETAEMNVS